MNVSILYGLLATLNCTFIANLICSSVVKNVSHINLRKLWFKWCQVQDWFNIGTHKKKYSWSSFVYLACGTNKMYRLQECRNVGISQHIYVMSVAWLITYCSITQYWSERSACAARVALQTGCVANEVATKFIVFFSFSLSPPYYFSPRRGCPRVVKICVCTN